ncbi:hypothetical protein HPB47_013216, partial [Ixodes persulcatus]
MSIRRSHKGLTLRAGSRVGSAIQWLGVKAARREPNSRSRSTPQRHDHVIVSEARQLLSCPAAPMPGCGIPAVRYGSRLDHVRRQTERIAVDELSHCTYKARHVDPDPSRLQLGFQREALVGHDFVPFLDAVFDPT